MSDLGIFMPSASLPARSRFHYAESLPLKCTPWLLLQEEGYDISPCLSLVLRHFASRTLHSFHAISSCNHLVSDLFSPTRVGSFQLSLALLVRYRSLAII